jgi:hypothetical protein
MEGDMLNSGDPVYGVFTYRLGSTRYPDLRIDGEILVARNDAHGKPTGEHQTIVISGDFLDANSAQNEAERQIKAMIDGHLPGLTV